MSDGWRCDDCDSPLDRITYKVNNGLCHECFDRVSKRDKLTKAGANVSTSKEETKETTEKQ